MRLLRKDVTDGKETVSLLIQMDTHRVGVSLKLKSGDVKAAFDLLERGAIVLTHEVGTLIPLSEDWSQRLYIPPRRWELSLVFLTGWVFDGVVEVHHKGTVIARGKRARRILKAILKEEGVPDD